MVRTAALIVALLACALTVAAADDWSAYRPQIEALLGDEATVELELGEKWRTEAPRDRDTWPAAEHKRLLIGPRADYREGYVVINEATEQVVGLVGPKVTGPVPSNVMSAQAAALIARQFAQRHHPDLFADGGEVVATVNRAITTQGAGTVHLQRRVQGVNVPTLADVGVRVYDGAIIYWRRKHLPLAESLQLPGGVTLAQARRIAAANMPIERSVPRFWFDESHEVLVTDQGQRNVWTLWADIKNETARKKTLEWFARWRIDALTGQVLGSDRFDLKRELLERYWAAGGEHCSSNGWPPPPANATDSRPIWLPDCSKLLFVSDRPHEGYPAWRRWRDGLFIVNADGTGLRCLIPRIGYFALSPDGSRVVFKNDQAGGLTIMALASGQTHEVARPEKDSYSKAAWVDNDRLVAYVHRDTSGSRLELLELSALAAEPRRLAEVRGGSDGSVGGMVVTPDGGTLYYTVYKYRSNDDTWDLFSLDLTTEGARPRMICAKPGQGRALQLLPGGKLFASANRSTTDHVPMFVVDLATGAAVQWKPSPIPVPGTELRELQLGNVCFTPDGRRLAFAARCQGPAHSSPNATLIYTIDLDGSNLRQVTPFNGGYVPMAGE